MRGSLRCCCTPRGAECRRPAFVGRRNDALRTPLLCHTRQPPGSRQSVCILGTRDVRERDRGAPMIRFHDLRYPHATLLLQEGVNVKVISERLGHANISITLDTYSHVLPSMQQEA